MKYDSTICERTDTFGTIWYWVDGEDDTAAFYQIPELPKCWTTERAAMHRDFTNIIKATCNKL